jgi:hypothetical protein
MQILLTRRQIANRCKSDIRTIDKKIRNGELRPVAYLERDGRLGKRLLPLFNKVELSNYE